MMKKTVIAAVIGALTAGALVGATTIAFAQADIIKQRQENRKATGPLMKGIKDAIDAKGDAKVIVANAAKLKELEVAFDKMFPAGSDKGETKALPTVWSDLAGFAAAGAAADAAYDKLAVAAGSGDMARNCRCVRRRRQGLRRLPHQVSRQGELTRRPGRFSDPRPRRRQPRRLFLCLFAEARRKGKGRSLGERPAFLWLPVAGVGG